MTGVDHVQALKYLDTLNKCLGKVTEKEREEILSEISAHIRDSAEEPNMSIDSILTRLGSPEKLAAAYREEIAIRSATVSSSPFLILNATLRLAERGMKGVVVFLVALFGYVLGATFILTSILKPILPRQTGLWIGPGVFDFGIHEPIYSDPVHEVLGWWYIPVALCLGGLSIWATTYAVRGLLRRFRRRDVQWTHSLPVSGSA
jgi:Protein of unknown function (DUF1700)